MFARLSLIAALAVAPMAMAQDQTPPPAPPATAEEIAAARAIADRLITAGEARGVFINTTKDGLAQVTHVGSGMTCRFEGGARDRIMVFPEGPGRPPRGDDVGCVSYDEALDIDLTLYATRYRPLPSEAAVLADARRAIESRWPDAQPYAEGLPTLSLEGQSPPQIAAYKIQLDGRQKLTLALVTHRGEWGFKARATGPYDQAMAVGLFAGVLLQGALMEREAPKAD